MTPVRGKTKGETMTIDYEAYSRDTDSIAEAATFEALTERNESYILHQNEIESFDPPYAERIGNVDGCDKIRLRENPDTVTGSFDLIECGKEVMIVGEVNDWYEVVLSDGREGYMMKQFVTIDE